MCMHPDTQTTVLGILGGMLTYWAGVGFALPTTRQEWATLLGSLALAALGYKSAGVKSSY